MAYVSKITTPNGTAYKLRTSFYAVCDTAAATAGKTVTIDGFELVTGVTVIIKFTYANGAASPTLEVSGTGAKPIVQYGTTAAATTSSTNGWYAGAVVSLTYDGTSWVFNKGYGTNSTYSNASLGTGYATQTNTSSVVACTANFASETYSLTVNGFVSVKFSYDVLANSTLNINSKGAKNIFYKGSAITGGIISAGDTATFAYDGTQYHLVAIDSKTAISVTSSAT